MIKPACPVVAAFAFSVFFACTDAPPSSDAGLPDRATVTGDGGAEPGDAQPGDSLLADSRPADSTTPADAATDAQVADDSGMDAGLDGGADNSTVVTIYDMQAPGSANHPAVDTRVAINGVFVTAIDTVGTTQGFWIQDANGGPYSGIFVFVRGDSNFDLSSIAIGDGLDLRGVYTEHYNLSQIVLDANGQVTKTGSINLLPPVDASGDYPGHEEKYEGTLIHLDGPCTVLSDIDGYGILQTSCATVRNHIYGFDLHQGDVLTRLDGVVDFSYDVFKILPRRADDLALAESGDAGLASDAAQSDAETPDQGSPDTAGQVTSGQCQGFLATRVLVGDRTISSDADLAAYAGIECITGNLLIDGTDLTQLDALQSLQRIGGNFELNRIDVQTISLLLLKVVVGTFDIKYMYTSYYSVNMPALTDVGGFHTINSDFNNLLMPALTTVHGGVSLNYGEVRQQLDFSELTSVDNFILNNFSVENVSIPKLSSVMDDVLFDNGSIAGDIQLPQLTTIGGKLDIRDYDMLENIDMGQLTTVGGDFNILWNDVLQDCEALNILAHCTVGGSTNINNTDACASNPCSTGFCSQDCSAQDYYVCE